MCSIPISCWSLQCSLRNALAVDSSSPGPILPAQKLSTARFSSRFAPIRGKPRLVAIAMTYCLPSFIKKCVVCQKNPQTQIMSLGISLFYPQTFPGQHPLSTKALHIYVTDRFSGSRIILLAAPSLPAFAGQWHQLRRSSPITAAGPLPIFTGFPIKPNGASCNVLLQ